MNSLPSASVHRHRHQSPGLGWCSLYTLGLLAHFFEESYPDSCPGLGPVLVSIPHTPRVEPDQTVSASGQGKGDNRGGAPNPQGHRGPIQVWIALRRCSDPGRAAMRPIPFLAWQPAIPPFSGSPEATTTPFNGHLIPAGIE